MKFNPVIVDRGPMEKAWKGKVIAAIRPEYDRHTLHTFQ
jgi:hypothetical protein